MKGLTLQKRSLHILLTGIGLIILTNTIVLAGVAYNRSGTPQSSITLTERELAIPYYFGDDEENSGIALRIDYRNKGGYDIPYYMYSRDANWLTKEKLNELGFDVSRPIAKTHEWRDDKHEKEKEVILVLEYDGPAYQAALKAAQQHVAVRKANAAPNSESDQNEIKEAEFVLKREQNTASRLFIIDGGLDPEKLRQQYPDTSQYLLLKGLVGLYIDRPGDKPSRYSGYIKSLSISEINIPHQYHAVLKPVMEKGNQREENQPPRYKVKVNIGKRLEPWVVGVEGL